MNQLNSKSQDCGVITETGRDKIHPINAKYLCSNLPYQVYVDNTGALLELTVRPITQTVVETHGSHGGIIGIHYQTAFQQIVKTILLARDGNLKEINEYGYLDPCILDDSVLYMLLNPVDLVGWYYLPVESHEQVIRDIGINRTSTIEPTKISEVLQIAIKKTQEQYRFLLQS